MQQVNEYFVHELAPTINDLLKQEEIIGQFDGIICLGHNWNRNKRHDGNFAISIQSEVNALAAILLAQKTKCKKIIVSTGDTSFDSMHNKSEARAMFEYIVQTVDAKLLSGIEICLEEVSIDTHSNAAQVRNFLLDNDWNISGNYVLLSNSYHLFPRALRAFNRVFCDSTNFIPAPAEEIIRDILIMEGDTGNYNNELLNLLRSKAFQFSTYMKYFKISTNVKELFPSQGPSYHLIATVLDGIIGGERMNKIIKGWRRKPKNIIES